MRDAILGRDASGAAVPGQRRPLLHGEVRIDLPEGESTATALDRMARGLRALGYPDVVRDGAVVRSAGLGALAHLTAYRLGDAWIARRLAFDAEPVPGGMIVRWSYRQRSGAIAFQLVFALAAAFALVGPLWRGPGALAAVALFLLPIAVHVLRIRTRFPRFLRRLAHADGR